MITISVTENEFAESRVGYVYVENDLEREAITVIQTGADPYLYFDKHYIPIRLKGDIKRLKLYNNLK